MRIFGGYRNLRAQNREEDAKFVENLLCLPFLPENDIDEVYEQLKAALSPNVRETLQPNLVLFERWRLTEGNFTSVRGFIKLLVNNADIQNEILRNTIGEFPTVWQFLSKFFIIL